MVQEIRSLQKLAIFFRVSRWGRRGGGACTRYFTVIELATCTLKFGMGKSTITTLKKNEPKIRGFVSKPPVLPSRQVYAFMYGYNYPLRWPVFWMVDLLRTSLPRHPLYCDCISIAPTCSITFLPGHTITHPVF